MHVTYSLHKIDAADRFSFDPNDYSRFKFGDQAVAKSFGLSLANGFIDHHLAQKPIEQQIVVIPSPYSFIPTATTAMKNFFIFQLNRWLAANKLPVVQETKVHRTVTYKEDYGELNAEERLNLIGNDLFHIDKAFLNNKTLLFLDDIKITGSHEAMILKMAKEYALTNHIFMLYFAELADKNIHPNIENYLNYHQVKTLWDLDEIVKSGSFCMNTRVVKYLLISDFSIFRTFLLNQTEDFVHYLYDLALGNNYHNIEAYHRNLNFVKEIIFTNNHKSVQNGN